MLEKLRRFDKDSGDMEDLISLSSFGRAFRSEYEQVGEEVPAWVDDQLKAVRREIRSRQADSVQMRLREAKARRASLSTIDEKRAKLDAEILELEKAAAQ